jgi:SagB-type dehydrogenase family enzyme
VIRGKSKRSRFPTRAKRIRYRRAPFLISYWLDDKLIFENYLTQRRITAAPLTCAILHFFGNWRSLDDLFSAQSEYTSRSLRGAVRLLEQHTFLQRYGRNPASGEKHLQAWGQWNPAAGFFHFSTKDVEFEPDAAKEFRTVLRLARLKSMPRPIKDYPKAKQIPLSTPQLEGEFSQVLLSRRTWRRFSPDPISLKALGNLLSLTWGVQKWINIPKLGTLAAKTSPSGGALHPIEAYVLARNVQGLIPGIYHYNAANHRLELLRRGATRRQITGYLANQWWYGGAAFVVFMTAVFERTQWKYDYARAYRAVLIEAGHLCQTFCLTATSLGLAPFCTLAFADSRVENALGIDGISESVLYVTGVGMRPTDEGRAHLLSGSDISNLNL